MDQDARETGVAERCDRLGGCVWRPPRRINDSDAVDLAETKVRSRCSPDAGPGEAKENEDGAIDANHVFIGKMSDARLTLGLGYRRDLVDHQLTRDSKPIVVRGVNGKTHQRRIDGLRRERADRDRACGVEGIVLQNDGWSGLARIVGPTGDSPHFAALHSRFQSETASTKS